MSDEIDKPIPECGQCEDYFKVQQIKTARIKELQKQLDDCAQKYLECSDKYSKMVIEKIKLQKQLEVAVEVLRFYEDKAFIVKNKDGDDFTLYHEDGVRAREALKKIGEIK